MPSKEREQWVLLFKPDEQSGRSQLHHLYPAVTTMVIEYQVARAPSFTEEDECMANITDFDPILMLGFGKRFQRFSVVGIDNPLLTEVLESYLAVKPAPAHLV
jgi:hypothetical protein